MSTSASANTLQQAYTVGEPVIGAGPARTRVGEDLRELRLAAGHRRHVTGQGVVGALAAAGIRGLQRGISTVAEISRASAAGLGHQKERTDGHRSGGSVHSLAWQIHRQTKIKRSG